MGDRLQDKVCIVTGAAQGIGAAYARAMAAEGADVAIIDLKRIDQAGTVDGRHQGARAAGRSRSKADVTDAEQMAAMGKTVVDELRSRRLPREQRRADVRPAHRDAGTTSSR